MKIQKYFKRFAGLLILGIILGLMPATALADAPTQVVSVNVGGSDQDDQYCRINSAGIWLKRTDVIYELSGSTDKPIQLWTPVSSDADADKRCHMRLNNVTVNGGIESKTVPIGIVVDVPAGTTNTFGRITVNNLSIFGGGTLNAGSVHVDFHESPMPCGMNIVDTALIIQNAAGLSCDWCGNIVLGGNADITITGNGTHPPLTLGSSYAANMVMQENAKLKCLQDDAAAPANAMVSGIEIFQNSPLLLKDNAYLETEGKNGATYKGDGLSTDGGITIQDQATLKTTGYDYALVADNITVNGGTVIADSKESYGIYASGAISITNGADVTASGKSQAIQSNGALTISGSTVNAESTNGVAIYSPANVSITDGASVTATSGTSCAIQSASGLTISGSTVDAESTNSVAIYSPADVSITDSVVEATSADRRRGIQSGGTASVSGSWIHTSGSENFNDHIEDSVLINKTTGTVIGNPTLPGNATLPADTTLTFPAGTSLTVPDGITFTNEGTIDGSLNITNNGTVICNGHVGGTATCVRKAVCEICGEEYGDLDPASHELAKIDAKAATHLATGNIEHYICNGCGKYFGDAAGTQEISQAETVTPKTLAHTVDGTGLHADADGHYNTCECGAILNKFEHTFKWVVDKEATEMETGEKHEECSICGYKKEAVEIPATGKPDDPDKPGDTPGNKPDDSGNSGGQGGSGNIGNAQTRPSQTHAPQTGDGGKFVPWMVLLLVSGMVLVMTTTQWKKRHALPTKSGHKI